MEEALLGVLGTLLLAAVAVVGWFMKGKAPELKPPPPAPVYEREAVKELKEVEALEEERAKAREDLEEVEALGPSDKRTERLARLGLMLLPVLLLGCAKHTPPTLYPTPVPPLTEPAPLEWERAQDECPAVEPVLPGKTVPAVDEGLATCRGILVPESEYAQLLADRADAVYWQGRAQVCQDGRERDRLHGQAVFDATWATGRELEKQNAQLRVGGAAVAVGALLVGTGVGIAAAKVGSL